MTKDTPFENVYQSAVFGEVVLCVRAHRFCTSVSVSCARRSVAIWNNAPSAMTHAIQIIISALSQIASPTAEHILFPECSFSFSHVGDISDRGAELLE